MHHVAPEPSLGTVFSRSKYIHYTSIDLNPRRAMIQMDIMDLQFPQNDFHVIYCSHVLEHVRDDGKAMAELFRVLKPKGWSILQVPVMAEKTFEDPSITTEKERLRAFGQRDHVRRYGKDYKDRLEEAGFLVSLYDFAKDIPETKREEMGLKREDIYLCEKK